MGWDGEVSDCYCYRTVHVTVPGSCPYTTMPHTETTDTDRFNSMAQFTLELVQPPVDLDKHVHVHKISNQRHTYQEL